MNCQVQRQELVSLSRGRGGGGVRGPGRERPRPRLLWEAVRRPRWREWTPSVTCLRPGGGGSRDRRRGAVTAGLWCVPSGKAG